MILLAIACDTCHARVAEEPIEIEDGFGEVYEWAKYQAEQAGWMETDKGPNWRWRCPECKRIAATTTLIHAPA